MKLKRRPSSLITLIALAAGTMISLVILVAGQLPRLQATRHAIDSARVSRSTVAAQQADLNRRRQEQSQLQRWQMTFDQDIWLLSAEESFFASWDAFGRQHGVTLEIPNVAEIVPTSEPVTRSVELSIRGQLNDVLKALTDLQTIKPLVAITEIRLTPGAAINTVIAAVQVETVWKE
ncbi:MAG: hypothetical protein HYY50_02480 [Candidatus Kerfeldbacteria bacterium]|nr:hypothetical protein [Candidatus Kerfeldbacteria bacterium]